MAISVAALATTVSGGNLEANENVPLGAYVVIVCHYRYTDGVSVYPTQLSNDNGNYYPRAWPTSTFQSGNFPSPAIFCGPVLNDISVGDVFNFVGYPDTAKAYKLTGADTFAQAASPAQNGGTIGGGPHATWSVGAQTAVDERVLIGVCASLDTAAFGDTTETGGDYSNQDLKELMTPHLGIDEWHSLLHFWDSQSSGTNTFTPSGAFPTADQLVWYAGHLVFRPVWVGKGRLSSMSRGPEGSIAHAHISGSALSVTHIDGSSGSGAPSASGMGQAQAVEILHDRAGRLLCLRGGQYDAVNDDYGGYNVRLFTSRKEARAWDAGQLLHSPGSPLSSDPGYSGLCAALDPKTGLLLLMLFEHATGEWLSSVGTLNSAGTTWSFTAPAGRSLGGTPTPLLGGPLARLINLDTGRYRFCYVEEGTVEHSDALSGAGAPDDGLWKMRNGDILKFAELAGVSAAGGVTWCASETVLAADAPYVSGSALVYPMFDAVDWLEDRRRGLHLFAYREVEAAWDLTAPLGMARVWKAVPGTLAANGVTWSWGTPETLRPTVGFPSSTATYQGVAFARRSDGVWRWFWESGQPVRSIRALRSDATGTLD